VKRICEGFGEGRLDAALAEFADDFTEEWPGSPDMPSIKSKAELKQTWEKLRIAFPDGKMAAARVLVDGDTVVAQMVFTGTHKGSFQGYAATGKPVGNEVLRIIKMADGKVKSARTYGDGLAILTQIGAIRGMPAAPVPKLPTALEVVTGPGTPANADVLKGVYASFATQDLAGYADRVTPETVYHDLAEGKTYTGVEANKQALMSWKTAFPIVKLDKAEFLTIGPYVIGESMLRAVHQGRLGPIKPTGKVVVMHGADVARLVDGKIAEGWGYADQAEVLRQLGVLPAPKDK
jgi:predicted ester cyclase